MENLRKIIREVIEETHTAQKDIEKFANSILKFLAQRCIDEYEYLRKYDSESTELYNLPIVHTGKMTGEGYDEIANFVQETSIKITPTTLIDKPSTRGRLQYASPESNNGREYFEIKLKYNQEGLYKINELLSDKYPDVKANDVYFRLFYIFHSTLIHELQHAYDAWRSKGKAFNSQLSQKYVRQQGLANQLEKKSREELTPEEIDALGNSYKAYLNLVHEINARYAQAMQKVRIKGYDDNFNDVMKTWDDVYSQFKLNFEGWRFLSDKMKKKLTRRVAKAYQEESENLKTAKEKYPEKGLDMIAENLQLADKTYFTPGRLSPRVREIIVSKITNGDAWTKLICDIYFAMVQNNHAVGDWAVRSIDDSSAEIDRSEKKLENDVMGVEDWKKVKSYYQQLKAYNKNVFPIIGLNPNGVEGIWSLIRALDQRATILEKIKLLPSIALRNMREDIRTPRGSSEMNNYRHNLEYFLTHYSFLNNRDAELKKFVEKKMFKSGMTLEKLLNFVEEKENLLGGKKFDKNVIKDLIEDNNHGELEIIYEQGDIMIVEVSGPYGIKEIGCNSLWCFTYGEGYSRDWSQYSYNDTVYVIIDFSETPDSANFMNVVIKPLVWNPKSEEDEEINDMTIFDMSNTNRYDALRFLDSTIGLDVAKKLLTFYVEPEEEDEDEDEDENSLMEIRKIVRQTILEQQENRVAAGVLIKCLSTDRIFLLLRNDPIPKWALVSGKIEDGENVLSGLKREIYEELFVNPSIIDFNFIRKEYISEKNMEFHYYEGFVDREFTPILDEENLDGRWFPREMLPSPLYKGMSDKIEKIYNSPEFVEDSKPEELIGEAALRIKDLPNTAALFVRPINQGHDLTIYDPTTKDVYGTITVSQRDYYGPDYFVSGVAAERGFGPLIYELAMMHISGEGKGLMPTRDGDVRSDAWRVWEKFYDRNDIKKKTLSPDSPYFKFDIIFTEDDFESDEERQEWLEEADPKDLRKLYIFNTVYYFDKNSEYTDLINRGVNYINKGFDEQKAVDAAEDFWNEKY